MNDIQREMLRTHEIFKVGKKHGLTPNETRRLSADALAEEEELGDLGDITNREIVSQISALNGPRSSILFRNHGNLTEHAITDNYHEKLSFKNSDPSDGFI